MVLKRKKFKNEPTGNTGNRKGYRSRSSESQLPTKRMSTFEAKRKIPALLTLPEDQVPDQIFVQIAA